MRSTWTAAWAAVVLLACLPARAADAPVPVRIRVLQGFRQGTPGLPPGLEDLKAQLSATAYVRWEQAEEVKVSLAPGKSVAVSLPGGRAVSVLLVESKSGAATFEVSAPDSRTRSRVTVPPGKRIVQQVSAEQGGSAWFVTIKASG
ncbi:MAG: hypothetical protein WCK73_00440 [Deltaproteobacteria bacterium]